MLKPLLTECLFGPCPTWHNWGGGVYDPYCNLQELVFYQKWKSKWALMKFHMMKLDIHFQDVSPSGKKNKKNTHKKNPKKRLTANKYLNIHFLISASIFNNSLGNVLLPVSLHTSNQLASSPPAVSSIFTVPNVKLQTESGDSIQVCARRNSHGKASSGSKHWPEAASCTWLPDRYVLITMHTKQCAAACSSTHSQEKHDSIQDLNRS